MNNLLLLLYLENLNVFFLGLLLGINLIQERLYKVVREKHG